MSGETRTYATYKAFCGNREQPWVTRISEAVDWTQQETTRDQVRIEAVLDTMAVTGASILHVGVGNSRFAQRFASRARRIDGLTVHQNEKTHADALGIANYTVYVLNKYSPAFSAVALLAESHLFVHTWPEKSYLALDFFTCGIDLGNSPGSKRGRCLRFGSRRSTCGGIRFFRSIFACPGQSKFRHAQVAVIHRKRSGSSSERV